MEPARNGEKESVVISVSCRPSCLLLYIRHTFLLEAFVSSVQVIATSTTRLLHNDLSRCSYSRSLIFATCSCPTSGFTCWCSLVSLFIDVCVDHEPISDDIHHPILHFLPFHYHSKLHVLSSHHYPLFADQHSLFVDCDSLFFDHHRLFVLLSDHHPLFADHYSLLTDHHSLLSDYYSLFNQLSTGYYPLFAFVQPHLHPFETKLRMLLDPYTLFVLVPV